MSVKISARIHDDLYNFLMEQDGKDFTEKLENVIRKVSDALPNVSDNKNYLDYQNEINYLDYQLAHRISLFNDKYSNTMLGDFLFNVNFIEKFRKGYSCEWKDDESFLTLFERLKEVYNESFSEAQQQEIKLYGNIRTSKNEYMAINV
jgi:hypothetical protein